MNETSSRAAQYVRMSTEHQNYSIEYQSVANLAYAVENGLEIVKTYTDAGISGLRLAKREGLKSLLADVVAGDHGFTVVLVYDVSRWGRFQDPDESAHYEFICRSAGAPIIYTAEQFLSDGSMAAVLLKQMKRAMAAEYSRELSVKVSGAKRGLSLKGFYTGGVCVYGMRRRTVAPNGDLGPVLESGDRKALLGHRVVLVAGPEEEVQVVRRIYTEYVTHGLRTRSIADRLNSEGIRSSRGHLWTRQKVGRLLADEKYAGVLVAGRHTSKLHEVRANPREQWVRVDGACPQLVHPGMAATARANLRRHSEGLSKEELLTDARAALAKHGRLSAAIIRAECPHEPSLYAQKFGSLAALYAQVGYRLDHRQFRASDRYAARLRGDALCLMSRAEMVRRIRAIYETNGTITSNLLRTDDTLPCLQKIRDQIGDMVAIYKLVGHTPSEKQRAAAAQRRRNSLGKTASFISLKRE